jgi:hypothetical protein
MSLQVISSTSTALFWGRRLNTRLYGLYSMFGFVGVLAEHVFEKLPATFRSRIIEASPAASSDGSAPQLRG